MRGMLICDSIPTDVWEDVNAVLRMLAKRANLDVEPQHVKKERSTSQMQQSGSEFFFNRGLRQQLVDFFLPW